MPRSRGALSRDPDPDVRPSAGQQWRRAGECPPFFVLAAGKAARGADGSIRIRFEPHANSRSAACSSCKSASV